MKIEYLKEFIVIAEELNFTKASIRLFIGQPTLSKHIALMEEELQTQLLVRDRHNVILTETGKILYESSRSTVSEYETGLEKLAHFKEGKKGSLKVGVLYYAIDDFVTPTMMTAEALYPEIELNILSYQPMGLVSDIMTGKVDLALMYKISEYNPELEFFKVGQTPFKLLAPADTPLGKKKIISIDELNGQPLVLQRQSPRLVGFILEFLEQRNVIPGRVILTEHVDTMAMDVLKYQAYATTTSGNYIKGKNLKVVEIRERDFVMEMGYLYRKDCKNLALPYFLEILRKTFQTYKD